ncbi:MAG: site-specific integrase [Clostridia bacterium]|nr:site-specific integrase [Clostridia bacterium]
MKRTNGTGTVQKLSGKRNKPYVAKYPTESFYESGNRKYTIIGLFRTKKEAVQALNLYDSTQSYGIAPPFPLIKKQNIKFSEVFELFKKKKLKDSDSKICKQTWDNYVAAYKHFKPLHNRYFSGLETDDFQDLIDSVKLSVSSKKKMKCLITQMYKIAIKKKYCFDDNSEDIEINGESSTEKKVFSHEQINMFIKDNSKASQIMLMIIFSGFRIQELLNLKVTDVDLKERSIHGGLKTKAGKNRTVFIHPYTLNIWKEWIDTANKNHYEYIFMRDSNNRLTQEYFRKHMLYPLEDKLGISRSLKPHNGRHTCATILHENKVPAETIRNLLGHARYSTTVETYIHPREEDIRHQIDQVTIPGIDIGIMG